MSLGKTLPSQAGRQRDLYATPAVVIEASKEGVKFSCQGDIGNGSVTIRQHTNVDKPEQNVAISLSEPVALTFSLKYLVNFCKASNLSRLWCCTCPRRCRCLSSTGSVVATCGSTWLPR